jgi:hypothetical protein
MTSPAWSVRRVHQLNDAQIEGLAEVLIDCVESGASVSFMHPLSLERAVAFWHEVVAEVAAGQRALVVGRRYSGDLRHRAAGVCSVREPTPPC